MESTCLKRLYKWGAIGLGSLFALLLVFPVFDDLPWQLAMHLLAGGFAHASASLPHMLPSGTALAGFSLLVLLSLGALQILLTKFAQSKEGAGFRWKPRWTISLMGLVFAAIGTACATVGLAHHLTWLMRDGAVYVDDGRGTTYRSISNCRQLITALRIYSSDHGGEYPKHLEDLVKDGILDHESFVRINRMIGRDGLPAPWIFLPGLTDSDPGDVLLVIGSCPVSRDTYIVGRNDSSVGLAKREDFEEAMDRYRKFVGAEGQGEAAPSPQQNRELTPPASVP